MLQTLVVRLEHQNRIYLLQEFAFMSDSACDHGSFTLKEHGSLTKCCGCLQHDLCALTRLALGVSSAHHPFLALTSFKSF